MRASLKPQPSRNRLEVQHKDFLLRVEVSTIYRYTSIGFKSRF